MDITDINARLERAQSNAMSSDSMSPDILRPIPRRAFNRFNSSTGSSTPSTPAQDANADADGGLDPAAASSSSSSKKMTRPALQSTPSRQRSLLNLTSSALFGIYSPTTDTGRDGSVISPGPSIPNTPRWTSEENYGRLGSTPTSTPASTRPRIQRAPSSHGLDSQFLVSWAVRALLLFGFGVTYGVIITHLHDNEKLAPVEVVGFHSFDWAHSLCWGVAGVALGSLLPWIDRVWEKRSGDAKNKKKSRAQGRMVKDARGNDDEMVDDDDDDDSSIAPPARTFDADWTSVVRSIGAFVGIAFAIRKLPWQSTLQVSLTLSLVNPVLWYLIDRSKAGFLLSAFVGIVGTAVLLGTNPTIVPAPATATATATSAYSALSTSLSSSSSFSSPSSVLSAVVASASASASSAAAAAAAAVTNSSSMHPSSSPSSASSSSLASASSIMSAAVVGMGMRFWGGEGREIGAGGGGGGGYLVTPESIGVGTWIASVLFCSCVCFGNIGRRLALKSGGHGRGRDRGQ